MHRLTTRPRGALLLSLVGLAACAGPRPMPGVEAVHPEGLPRACEAALVATAAEASAPDSVEVRGVVSGGVRDGRDWRAAGALILLRSQDAEPPVPEGDDSACDTVFCQPDVVAHAWADRSGRFALTAPPGRYVVEARLTGAWPVETTAVDLGPGEGVALQVDLRSYDCTEMEHISRARSVGASRPRTASGPESRGRA